MIALGLASRRPELVGGLVVHEPPLFGIDAIRGKVELQPVKAAIEARLFAAARQIRAGDPPGGVAQFLEEVTLGPGAWEHLPEEVRQTMVANASTFLEKVDDPQGPNSMSRRCRGIRCLSSSPKETGALRRCGWS